MHDTSGDRYMERRVVVTGVGPVSLALPGSPGSRSTYQENVPTKNGVQESKTGLIIEGSQGRSILRR